MAIQDKMNLLVELHAISLGRSYKSAAEGTTRALKIIDDYRKKHSLIGCISPVHIKDLHAGSQAFEAKTPNVHGKFQEISEDVEFSLRDIGIEVGDSISADLGDWLQESLRGSTLCVVRFDKTTRKTSVVPLSPQKSRDAIVSLLEKGIKQIMEDWDAMSKQNTNPDPGNPRELEKATTSTVQPNC